MQTDATEDRVAKLESELAEAKDQLLRAYADMQNQRKRFAAEKESIRRLAADELIRELLPILDNFERTIAAAESGASLEALLEGVKSIDRQLRSVLEARRFEKIESKGRAFDPMLHEAVEALETHSHPEGTVVEELVPGYKLADVVIRPAKVRVAKKP